MSDIGMLPPDAVRTRGEPPVGTVITLVRHGEARCNVDGVIGGATGCAGLTDKGQRQAQALRRHRERHGEWAGAVLLTSALPRARETGRLVMDRDDLEAHARFNELEPGEADGWTWDEYRARVESPDWSLDPDAPFAPGGESWRGFANRVVAALTWTAETYGAQRVVIFTHGGVIEQAIRAVTDEDDAVRLRLRTDHCSVTEIEWGAQRRLLRYNERAL